MTRFNMKRNTGLDRVRSLRDEQYEQYHCPPLTVEINCDVSSAYKRNFEPVNASPVVFQKSFSQDVLSNTFSITVS